MRRQKTGVDLQSSWRDRVFRAGLTMSMLALLSAAMLGRSQVHAQSSALLSTSTITPANVVIYAEISLDTESSQLQQLDELLARLGSEESLIDAINQSATGATFDVDLTDAEVAVGVLPSALEAGSEMGGDVLGGASPDEIASDLTSAGTSAPDQGVVVVIRPTDIAALEATARESAGSDAQTEQYLGAEIVSDTDSDGSLSSFAVVEEFMLVGPGVDDVKTYVDVALGNGDSLADVEQFRTASDLLPSERIGFAYANGPVLFDAMSDAFNESTLDSAVRDAYAAYTGYTGMTISADDAGLRFESVVVPENGNADATASSDAGVRDMASRMPIDTAVFASGVDLGQTSALKSLGLALVAGLGTLTSDSGVDEPSASPVPVSVDELYDSLEQMIGFNIKSDFVDQMTGPYGFGVWNIDAEDPADVEAVLVSGVTDEEVLGDAVGTISLLIQAGGQGEFNVTTRQLDAGAVNHVEFDSNGAPVLIDYGIVDGEFVLGLGDGVETLLDGPSESLADSAAYTTALSYLPEEFQSVYFVDIEQISDATAGISGASMGESDFMAEMMGTPISETPVQSLAVVTYVEDGYTFSSAILVAP